MSARMEHDRFIEISTAELESVEGGGLPVAVIVGAPIVAATIAAGATLVAVAAAGYAVGKDLAESENDECECPDETTK
jgi:hypothetical protein